MKRTIQTHIDAIRAGKVDRTNVIGIRKALNTNERRQQGRSVGRTSPKVEDEDCELILELLAELKPEVTGELVETGKAQLQNRRYRKQLSSVAEIVADVQSFRLVGFDFIGSHMLCATPVYRAYDSKGQSFPFRNVPWQAGGNGPELVSPDYF